MPGSQPVTSTRSCSVISTPAFRSRISPPRWCCRPRPSCASSGRRGWRTPAPPAPPPCTPAVHQGIKSMGARAARIVLVVGVEQMTTTPAAEIGSNFLKASYVREEAEIDGGFAGIFGKIAGLYFQKWGDQSDALAMIAAKNHKNGVGNPYAQMRKDLGYEFCRTESEKNPFVAGPLKRTDCSLVSYGAAEHVQDFLPMSKRDILKFEGCAHAWHGALAKAGLKHGDLSFVETHDCFTI